MTPGHRIFLEQMLHNERLRLARVNQLIADMPESKAICALAKPIARQCIENILNIRLALDDSSEGERAWS